MRCKGRFHQIKLDTIQLSDNFQLTVRAVPLDSRMPFIEFAQDLDGVEVIADDFLIAGFDETEEEVSRSLETNERAFFQKCREWNLKPNKEKMKRAQTEVRFMDIS